jgi:hypothetical protein
VERDERATHPPAENPPEETEAGDSNEERPGGPYGNPEVDEEALRKRQEEKERESGDGPP